MKILFLHLSDIHLHSSIKIDSSIINLMVQSLNTLEHFDECILLLTGDIAFSGNVNEYKIAKKFIGSITSNIKEKYEFIENIKVYVVPGNHDINNDNIQKNRNDIVNILKGNEIENHINSELKRFNGFFDFAESNFCFKYNKLIDVLHWEKEGYKIQINLVNSELFSTFKDKNNDNDKGVHYLPISEIEKLRRKDKIDLVISLSHRSPEWFEWNSGNKLKEFLQRDSDILFLGHEHVDNINFVDNKIVSLARGIDFNKFIFSFSTVLLDSISNNCIINLFNWDDKKGLFKTVENREIHLVKQGPWNLKPKYEFMRDLDSDERGSSIKRYYVFSGVERKNDIKKPEEITEWNEFLDIIKTYKYIFIEGDDLSGKTTLLKQLYIDLQKDFIPLFLSFEDIKIKPNKIEKQLDKVIKNAFIDQYEDFEDYQKFEQINISEKIILIDDYGRVKSKYFDEIINYISNKFGTFILTCPPEQSVDIIESTKKMLTMSSEDNFTIKLKILPFFSNKRKELIKKYYESNINDCVDTDKVVNKLNNFIKNQLRFFYLNPSFITMYINYCMQTRELEGTPNVFGKVFENNIVNAIRRFTSDTDLEEYSVVLEEIAFYIHFKEIYPISIVDISKIITNYNENFYMNVDINNFLNVMKKAKILKSEDNNYKFINTNLLAYFVAKSLNSLLQNGDGKKELELVVKKICFNINGDILLFLSYISNNYKILEYLKDITINHMDSWDEFNMDKGNINFINGYSKETILNLPTDSDREKNEIIERKREKDLIKKKEDNIMSDLYDYNCDLMETDTYKLNQAIKFTSLITKTLPNFNHRLKKDQKQIYTNMIFKYPNKIIYSVLSIIDKNHNFIIDDIYNFLIKINIKNISKKDIAKALLDSTENYILNTFNYFSSLSANSKTIKALNLFEDKGNRSNYLLQKLLMNFHVSDLQEFIKIADQIYFNTKKPMIKSMVKRIVYKYLLINRNLKMIGPLASFAQRYFNTSDKKKLFK